MRNVYRSIKQALRAAFEPAERVATNKVGVKGETSPFYLTLKIIPKTATVIKI